MSSIVYTEQENRIWWDRLGKTGQNELFDKIIDKANTPHVRSWIENLVTIYERGGVLSDKNLASLRKWDR